MPTARELLEQADAMMRRNRAPVVDADIPELTDVVPESAFEFPAAPVVLEDGLEAVPAATESGPASLSDASLPEGEPSIWLDEAALRDDLTLGEVSITGPAPDSVLGVAPVASESAPDSLLEATPVASESAPDSILEATPLPTEAAPETGVPSPPVQIGEAVPEVELAPAIPVESTADAGGAQSAGAPMVAPPSRDEDMARWEALAEEIRMQVLQRIDIFTDTGLKEQLNERLQPMVDRASAELVGTISVHVGQLLRAYVAEAIEREIEKWRAGKG